MLKEGWLRKKRELRKNSKVSVTVDEEDKEWRER